MTTKKPPSFWLMKSEPSAYSIEDLQKEGEGFWDGVRNYQARNFMMRDMRTGDRVLFYHSNAKPPRVTGVAGLAVVCKEATADPTAWDKQSKYYDPRSTKDKPRWFAVTLRFVKAFQQTVPLSAIRQEKDLAQMALLKKGQRLSVLPVTEKEYHRIVQMAQ